MIDPIACDRRGMGTMSDRMARTVVALGGGAATIAIAGWLDREVIAGVQRNSAAASDVTLAAVAFSLGYLMIAAGVLLIVVLARRATYPVVGVLYVLGGAFLTFLFPVTWFLTAKGSSPALLTGPLADFLVTVWMKTEQSPLNAAAILGADMLLVGLVTIGSSIRERGRSSRAVAVGRLETRVGQP
jgi:hypothetical protein